MPSLFPPIEPYDCGFLQVTSVHSIYYEQCGQPDGIPVVFLHGGPGGGCSAMHRQLFNPKFYRVILFDQRGCGRSLPTSELKENDTWQLVNDCEALRTFLKIDRWAVFGGSWGSTLALAYATKHPDKIMKLFLRGIFTLRKKEISWFYQEGASFIYPDEFEHFLAPVPDSERSDLVQAYYKRLTGEDKQARRIFAKAWTKWEAATSKLLQSQELIDEFSDDKFSDVFARIECHYFVNNGFFPYDDYLINMVDTYRNIPAIIVQGRYDVVCPMQTAWDLHKAWPQAQFCVVNDAGHSVTESGITSALMQSLEEFIKEYK